MGPEVSWLARAKLITKEEIEKVQALIFNTFLAKAQELEGKKSMNSPMVHDQGWLPVSGIKTLDDCIKRCFTGKKTDSVSAGSYSYVLNPYIAVPLGSAFNPTEPGKKLEIKDVYFIGIPKVKATLEAWDEAYKASTFKNTMRNFVIDQGWQGIFMHELNLGIEDFNVLHLTDWLRKANTQKAEAKPSATNEFKEYFEAIFAKLDEILSLLEAKA